MGLLMYTEEKSNMALADCVQDRVLLGDRCRALNLGCRCVRHRQTLPRKDVRNGSVELQKELLRA